MMLLYWSKDSKQKNFDNTVDIATVMTF